MRECSSQGQSAPRAHGEAMNDDLDRALRELPVHEVDPVFAERVRRAAVREIALRAPLLPLAAAVVSFVYLAWAVSYAGALYR